MRRIVVDLDPRLSQRQTDYLISAIAAQIEDWPDVVWREEPADPRRVHHPESGWGVVRRHRRAELWPDLTERWLIHWDSGRRSWATERQLNRRPSSTLEHLTS